MYELIKEYAALAVNTACGPLHPKQVIGVSLILFTRFSTVYMRLPRKSILQLSCHKVFLG